jgi:membrane associated rhomboid family serine protease
VRLFCGVYDILLTVCTTGSAASHYLSREAQQHHLQESTSKWHLLAFFLSGILKIACSQKTNLLPVSPPAGLFSGLVSHAVAVKLRYPRLLSQLSSPVPAATTIASAARTLKTADIAPSLGSSGAIYATVTLTALGFPDTEIALLIPPTFPIPIQYGVGGLVAMDLLGAIRGWRFVFLPLWYIVNDIDWRRQILGSLGSSWGRSVRGGLLCLWPWFLVFHERLTSVAKAGAGPKRLK